MNSTFAIIVIIAIVVIGHDSWLSVGCVLPCPARTPLSKMLAMSSEQFGVLEHSHQNCTQYGEVPKNGDKLQDTHTIDVRKQKLDYPCWMSCNHAWLPRTCNQRGISKVQATKLISSNTASKSELDFHGISVWKRPCGCGRHQPHLNLVGLGLRSVPASKSSCLVSPAITPNRSLLICQGKINGLQDIGWLYDIPVVVCCSRCATTTAPTCKDQHSALAGCTGFIDVQLALSYIKYINCLIITDRRWEVRRKTLIPLGDAFFYICCGGGLMILMFGRMRSWSNSSACAAQSGRGAMMCPWKSVEILLGVMRTYR